MTAVISIEPFPDDDSAPFTLKPLTGAIPSDAVDHVVYTMDNNSTGFVTGTVTVTALGSSAGLTMPTLPAGWKYEGWVVMDGTPVTSGTFTALDQVDDNDPYSGPDSGPPFPGEDFVEDAPAGLTFPTDIAGATAVISIEPSPDNNPLPFTLKPLTGAIPSDAVDHVSYDLTASSATFPTGTAVIKQ